MKRPRHMKPDIFLAAILVNVGLVIAIVQAFAP